ncbi:hypothetical protein Scep_030350 [Stephania cephalantha]|uniref:Uncharacterized protein n=1 Tax=Stephania cephalantha TaxID=152367 RepID=A0AAP0HEA0_9MAGN
MEKVIKHPRVLRKIQEELNEVVDPHRMDNVEEFLPERHLVTTTGSGTIGRGRDQPRGRNKDPAVQRWQEKFPRELCSG